MKTLATFFLIAFLILSSRTMRAQTSVYAAVSEANYGYTVYNNSLDVKGDVVGFTGGATYLFSGASRLRAGIDARFDASPGVRGGEAGLVAFRVAFVPHHARVSPYFQIGGGVVSTTYTTGVCSLSCSVLQTRRSGGVLELALGLNVRINDHFFIRPLELMGTGGNNVGHATIGTGVGYTF